MLFCCYHTACFPYRLQDRFFVQRLDGMGVDDLCIDAQLSQFLSCLDRLPYQMAGCDDADILALIHHPGLTDLKLLIRVRKDRNYRTSETQVDRSFVFSDGKDRKSTRLTSSN